ncbi:hypothetical protein OHA44_37320 [Streptomyces sp. NBC_00144]
MTTAPRLSVCLTFDFDPLSVHLGRLGTWRQQPSTHGGDRDGGPAVTR